jgi:hypothetical protein
MNFDATLNNNWQQSTKKTGGVKKMFGSRKNISAIVAILLGVLIIAFALTVKETSGAEVPVYSHAK